METFIKAFRRNPDGSWTCIRAATLPGPGGRIQVTEGSTFFPGTIFMGVELTVWLEEQSAKTRS